MRINVLRPPLNRSSYGLDRGIEAEVENSIVVVALFECCKDTDNRLLSIVLSRALWSRGKDTAIVNPFAMSGSIASSMNMQSMLYFMTTHIGPEDNDVLQNMALELCTCFACKLYIKFYKFLLL